MGSAYCVTEAEIEDRGSLDEEHALPLDGGHYPGHLEQEAPLDQDLHSCDMDLLPTKDQCLALTDDQCRRIQNFLDPYHQRIQKDWALEYQPVLIRLYMTRMSFYEIASLMTPRLIWS